MPGYTLLEVVVGIGIISLVATLLAVGYPSTRDTQELLVAQQRFEALLRDAQQQARNEERSPDCLASVSEEDRNVCSDIGLALRGQVMTLFADTVGADQRYTPGADFILTEQQLPEGVTVADLDLVWLSVPPTTTLYADGAAVVDDTAPQEVTLRYRSHSLTVAVFPFGYVVRQ